MRDPAVIDVDPHAARSLRTDEDEHEVPMPAPRRRPRRWALPLGAVTAAAIVALIVVHNVTPPALRLTTVTRGAAVDAVYAGGTVETIDHVEINARIAGTVDEILVKEGARVTRGELLARLGVPALRIELDRGRAEVDAARRRAAPSAEVLGAQERMLAAQLSDARAAHAQTERLANAGSVATRDEERDRLHVATLEHQLEMVGAQRRETEVLRQADVARSSSDFAGAEARSRDADVRSPIDGDVLRVIVDPGRLVQANEPLLRVGDAQRLHVEALVDEEDIARVRLDAPCAIRVSSFGDRVLHGRVSHIAPEADREHHSFRIFVTVDETIEGLRPGMSAEVDVITIRRDGTLLVSREAVHEDHVWRLEADDRLHRCAVKTGIGDLDHVEVIEGLAEGDRVVALPDADLHDGMRARAEAAADSASTAAPHPEAR